MVPRVAVGENCFRGGGEEPDNLSTGCSIPGVNAESTRSSFGFNTLVTLEYYCNYFGYLYCGYCLNWGSVLLILPVLTSVLGGSVLLILPVLAVLRAPALQYSVLGRRIYSLL